eukprot:6209341-Pleurochrysis_carterae.AAC.2
MESGLQLDFTSFGCPLTGYINITQVDARIRTKQRYLRPRALASGSQAASAAASAARRRDAAALRHAPEMCPILPQI